MTMFALPTLTTWQNAAGGWSNTSGGPDNGTYPGSTDQVIFDVNSGASRYINIPGSTTIFCGSITMATCAAIGFNIPSGSEIRVFAGSYPTDMTKCLGLYGAGNFYYSYFRGNSAQNFTPPQAIATTMTMSANVTLTGPLVLSNSLTINGGNDSSGNFYLSTLTTNGNAVTVATLTDNGSAAYYLGGGSITVTGLAGQSSGSIFSPGNNFYYQGGTIIVDAKNGLGPLTVTASGGDLTGSVWFKSTPSGYAVTYSPGVAINNFRVDAGCRVALGAGYTVNANSYTISGAANSRASITGASASTKSAMKLNAGATQSRQYFNSTDLSNIDFSPANIFYGRGCTTTNCTGFTNTTIAMNHFNFL